MISVVVAVHNSEEFLDQCLKSISEQTYDSFEAILIDDGSQDHSGEICDAWACADGRFRVLHTAARGVSAARNEGIAHAVGDYVCFVDSDDILLPSHLELLVSMQAPGTLPVVRYERFLSDGAIHHLTICDGSDWSAARCVDVKVSCFTDLLVESMLNPVWNKLFDMGVIRDAGLLFDEQLELAEDAVFNAKYIGTGIQSFRVANEVTYLYRQHGNGTLATRYQPRYPEAIRSEYAAYLCAARILRCADSCVEAIFFNYVNDIVFGVENVYSNRSRMDPKEYARELERRRKDPLVDEALKHLRGVRGAVQRLRWAVISKGPFTVEFFLRRIVKRLLGMV